MTGVSGKVTAGGKGFSAEIVVEGLEPLRAALKEFEPKLLKTMDREIRAVARGVTSKADANWTRTGSTPIYKIRSSSRGKRVGVRILIPGGASHASNDWSEPSVLGAILEFFGKVGTKTAQAASCLQTLNERYGEPGRFLWSAWDDSKDFAMDAIEASVRRAERDLQSELDRRGVSY
jgi:hypothetical protein